MHIHMYLYIYIYIVYTYLLADAQPAAIVDASRDRDLELLVFLHAPTPRTSAAVLIHDFARALALRYINVTDENVMSYVNESCHI